MEQILLTAVLTSLSTVAMHILFENGMLLDFIPEWMGRKQTMQGFTAINAPRWHKPLFDCPYCMASVWGTFFFFALQFMGVHSLPLEYWPLICLINIPLNGVIDSIR